MDTDDQACDRLLRKGSKSFHLASRLLPARLRAPTRALYAFCRTADDAVDDGADPGNAVDELRNRVDRIYDGLGLDDPVDRAFARVVEQYRIPKTLPGALVEGMQWDAEGRTYETVRELQGYAVRVASSVGVMMTLLMGQRSPWILARACDLGTAMQLTNIARDVGEDARRGRLYLPQEWLRQEGIDPGRWLRKPAFDTALGHVVRRLLGVAATFYHRAAPGIDRLPADCRFAIRAASMLYADIGRVVARNRYDSVSIRAVVPFWRKLWVLLRAAYGSGSKVDPAALAQHAECAPPSAFLVHAVWEQDRRPVGELAA